jgi:hypothetical protein
MDAVRRASIAGTAAVVAAVALLAVIGVEPVTALTTGTGLSRFPPGLTRSPYRSTFSGG